MNPQQWTYKVGILGCPTRIEPWNEEQVDRIKQLGFNTIQLNIAWGSRPADEPLNLEDVVEVPAELAAALSQPVPLNSDTSPAAVSRRRADLQQRIRLSRQAGLRTLFHFGAPYNGSDGYHDYKLHNCLLDGRTSERYQLLLKLFHRQFPGVDDLLIYTYDQDAWLCNEFGLCERCRGIPLHERVVPFINQLAAGWAELNPEGRLWWEPWELSAGQVLQSIQRLDPRKVGLALHSNIAEVTATLPVDRFLRNACRQADSLGIPVLVEGFFGGPTEELEPFTHLASPQVTLRQLQLIAGLPGVVGVKEYFGLAPSKEDPNLRATAAFLRDPAQSEQAHIRSIAAAYDPHAEQIAAFWSLCSDAMELLPWDISWFMRKIGQCEVRHTMNAAFIRGQMCHTPSWDSTRKAIFMKTDSLEPDPWLLEDIQLRCNLAADRMEAALRIGTAILSGLEEPLAEPLAGPLAQGLEELQGLRARVLSYVYHLRETNLATLMRMYLQEGQPIPAFIRAEMEEMLKLDQLNQGGNEPIDAALQLFAQSPEAFLQQYFLVPEDDVWPIGPHSLTSR